MLRRTRTQVREGANPKPVAVGGRRQLRKTKRDKWKMTLAECRPDVVGFDTKQECEDERAYLRALDGLRLMLTNIDDRYKEALNKLETLPDKLAKELKKMTRGLRPDEEPDPRTRERMDSTRAKYEGMLANLTTLVAGVEDAWRERIFDPVRLDKHKTRVLFDEAKGSVSYEHFADAFRTATGTKLDLGPPLQSSLEAGMGCAPTVVVKAKPCYCIDCEWRAWVARNQPVEGEDNETTPFFMKDGTKVLRSEKGEPVIRLDGDEYEVVGPHFTHEHRVAEAGLPATPTRMNWNVMVNSATNWLSDQVGAFLGLRAPTTTGRIPDLDELRRQRLAFFRATGGGGQAGATPAM